MGRMWNLPMPNIDAVLTLASTMLKSDFFREGITVEDLGVDGLSPEKLEKLVL
jgi:opine dehydrogenase